MADSTELLFFDTFSHESSEASGLCNIVYASELQPMKFNTVIISVILCAVGFVKMNEFVMIPVDGVGGNGAISPTKSKRI